MKKIIALLLLLCCAPRLQAQTFAEWFRQGKTQKKYLLEQIAALQVYIGIAKDGYKATGKGLQVIGEIKDGDFTTFKNYFTGLKAVSPSVAAFPNAREIIGIQQAIAPIVAKSNRFANGSEVFSSQQKTYIQSVYTRLAADCNRTIEELEAVTTPGKLEMKDDERMERMEKLLADSQQQYRFAKKFADGISVLAVQKRKAEQETGNLNKMYHIK